MKRKNMLPGFGCIVFWLLIGNLSFAQKFSYDNWSRNFNIELLSLIDSNPQQTNPLPYYTLFIETGNGRYIKADDPYIYGVNASKNYSYKIPSNSTAILNIIGHYDTIKPPRGNYAIPNLSNSSTQDDPPQTKLAANKQIGFDYSDTTVVIGDTMTLVITHKPDFYNQSIVAFFYNHEKKVFKEITDPGIKYPFIFSNINGDVIQEINAVRVRNEVNYAIHTSSASFPRYIRDALSAAMTGFEDAIYFMVPGGLGADERNIFISMAIPPNSDLISSATQIKAVLFKHNGAKILSQEPVSNTLAIGQFASDPNGIRTNPHCLDPAQPFSKPIKYDITFHNDGKGDAESVIVEVLIPDGIQLPPSLNINPRSFRVESMVSRQNVNFVRGTLSPPVGIKPSYTYYVETSGSVRKIIFKLLHIKLPGTLRKPKDMLSRHGTISFTLNTIPASQDQRDIDKLKCIFSDVSIRFSSLIGREETWGTPLKDWDLVKRDCFPLIPDPNPCPRIAKANLPPRTQ